MSLLPKAEEGYRTINLFAMITRVWTRTRRMVIRKWEAAQERPYLFAGKGKSARDAAWLMAARAEKASMDNNVYVQISLDLVTAFDFVKHEVLF